MFGFVFREIPNPKGSTLFDEINRKLSAILCIRQMICEEFQLLLSVKSQDGYVMIFDIFLIKLVFMSSSFDSIETITICVNRCNGYEAQ